MKYRCHYYKAGFEEISGNGFQTCHLNGDFEKPNCNEGDISTCFHTQDPKVLNAVNKMRRKLTQEKDIIKSDLEKLAQAYS